MRIEAAISAITPTKLSTNIAPYPTIACDSRSIILGVVPEATSEWNPEIAPQAIVMKTKGKSGPGMIGPPPAMKPVTRGISIVGAITITPTPSRATTLTFMKLER